MHSKLHCGVVGSWAAGTGACSSWVPPCMAEQNTDLGLLVMTDYIKSLWGCQLSKVGFLIGIAFHVKPVLWRI